MSGTPNLKLTVRPAEPADLPAVIQLRNRCFSVSHWRTDEERVDYMRRVFFENPWRDPAIGPFVSMDGDNVVGFVGLIPRKMRLNNRSIVAALASQFMVAPEQRRRGIGRGLIEAIFSGPQELTFNDIPEPATERIWVGSGGVSAPMYKFFWQLSLRPFSHAATGLGMSWSARIMRRAASPGLKVLDVLAARHNRQSGSTYTLEELTAATAVADLEALVAADVLRATHSKEDVQWLSAQLREKWGDENVHAIRLCSPNGDCAGIVIYVVAERMAHIHLLIGKAGQENQVLDFVLGHFLKRGHIAARGRFQPVMINAFKHRDIPFLLEGHGLLAHSRDPELLTHLLAGKALFTGLTGEWCLHF